jgi:hypothetical protein
VVGGVCRFFFWFRHPACRVRTLGPALILAGIVLVGIGTLSVATRAVQAQSNAGLALFGEMMPVFSSPRCQNCHGGVNPVTGANHEPGPVADSTRLSNGDMGFDEQRVCQECHTAGTANWRTAPSNMSFVGKDTLTLCRQIRRSVGLEGNDPDASAAFVNHLAADDLIGVGFVGQGGIGEDSPFASIAPDPPPMSRAEMVAAAKQWVGEGQAKCGASTWSGVITQTVKAQNHEDRQPGTLLVKDSATDLNITLAVVQSTATANVFFTQHDFTDAPPNRPCWVIHYSWKADGRGDAELDVIGDTDAGGMYLAWSVPAYSGTEHTEMRTVPPACKPVLRDDPYSVAKSHGGVQPTVDPNDLNHVAGQKVIEDPNNNTTTTIKWDLSRDP